MSDFATRFGYLAPATDINESEMPSSLRAGLWDILCSYYFSDIYGRSAYGSIYSDHFKSLTRQIWFEYYCEPVDTRPSNAGESLKLIRSRFFSWQFYKIYEFLEFMSKRNPIGSKRQNSFRKGINSVLARERAAFRFADDLLVKLSDENQLIEVTTAVQSKSEAVSEHIRTAASLYSRSEDPDYRNSIKESISAVEAAVSYVTGRKTSGIAKPLKSIATQYEIHQALRDGFEKIYAWTSDDSGIRHGLMVKSTVTQEDARFMLISCSAFANYLMALRVRFGEVLAE